MIKLKTKNQKILVSEISITPFIDVVFNLLLFFMISSSILDISQIEINLPESESNVLVEDGSIILKINAGGKIILDGREIDKTNLETFLTFPKDPNQNLTIAADKSSQIGLIIEIYNIAQKKGYKNISIATAK